MVPRRRTDRAESACRSEGVPFFIEELARAYREADALQLMDGTWMMTRLSGPMVPSSIQSLIERRLAQLSEDSRGFLADAGVLGRRFKLSVLAPVLANVRREDEKPEWELAEELDMAVQLGLIVEEADDAEYDFTFSHDQIRASLLDDMPRRRRQAIHGAITEILSSQEGDVDLSMLAYHAMKSGNNPEAVSSAVAAKAALAASAPEGEHSAYRRHPARCVGPCGPDRDAQGQGRRPRNARPGDGSHRESRRDECLEWCDHLTWARIRSKAAKGFGLAGDRGLRRRGRIGNNRARDGRRGRIPRP